MTSKHILSAEQNQAANPNENIWVQANAGTGKTSILIQRLLRILFRSYNHSDSEIYSLGILCLTYTNAGAGEMKNRILVALRDWAVMSDEKLYDMLSGITLKPESTDIQHARQIFFKYIDNPDMLKIKTIHGFCEEILRRFPLEAGVSPSWNLVSDSNQKILLNDAFHRLINSTNYDNNTDSVNNIRIINAFARIVERVSEHSFDELLGILTNQYKQFFYIKDHVKYREYFIDTTKQFLKPDIDTDAEISNEKLQIIIESVQIDINSSKKPAAYLINLLNLTVQYINKTINFNEYKNAYLTATDTKNINISKKDYLAKEQERVYAIQQRELDQQVLNDTIALFDLSAAFAQVYKDIKNERNLLDFDDLILYTRKLFEKTDTMGWVLSQLDMTLGHILLDEAQDTSPEQWEILHMLSGDFFTDGDTEYNNRSLFVVGDTKQSIYGFQGADPAAFAKSHENISAQITNNLRQIHEVPLTQSFRSTLSILSAVDYFFGHQKIRELTGFINNDHKCFRIGVSGLVELHPVVSKNDD